MGTVHYQSLARRLTLQNVLIIATSLLVAGGLSFTLFYSMVIQRIESSSLLHATQLASQIEVMLVFGDSNSLTTELGYHADYRPTEQIVVFTPDGDVFARWPHLPTLTTENSVHLSVSQPLLQRENSLLHIWVPVVGKDRIEGVLYIHEQLDQEMALLYRFLAGQITLIVLVFMVAGFWLRHAHRHAFRPLKELTELATEISNTRNFKLRSTVHQHDDIGRLSSHFNELLKRLEFWQKDLYQQLADQQAHGDAMQALAHSDELTGINNRLTFNHHLSHQIAYADEHKQTVALLFIDLDKFKFVNDTYGHQAGDLVLVTVANRLQECIRQQDDCYRLGGDEFAVLMRAMPNASAADYLAQRILDMVALPISFQEQLLPIGCSIGIALYPDNANHATLLLELADKAMYQAKHSGRNQYVRYGATL